MQTETHSSKAARSTHSPIRTSTAVNILNHAIEHLKPLAVGDTQKGIEPNAEALAISTMAQAMVASVTRQPIYLADYVADVRDEVICEYIGTIRSKDKQAYAQSYLNSLRFGGKVKPSSITATAKHDVRKTIGAILRFEEVR